MPTQPRLLLIDDDDLIRDLYSEVLSSAGFAVELASDGQQGLDLLTRGGYDVVLLDLIMPDLDGVSVLKELEKITPAQPNHNIIVLTNLDFQPTLDEVTAHGAIGYLIKSSRTPDEVVSYIRTMTSGGKSPYAS